MVAEGLRSGVVSNRADVEEGLKGCRGSGGRVLVEYSYETEGSVR